MANILVDSDLCKSWEKSGKHEFAKLCRSLEDETVDGIGRKDLKTGLYELCQLAVNGKLRVEQAAAALADAAEHHAATESTLVDVFNVLDVETSCQEEKLPRDKFLNLVQATTNFISESLMKERLDLETLETLGLIPSKDAIQSKYVKTKTKIYYRQQKFNLLREENEGYAKLITELNQEMMGAISCDDILRNIKSLIGCFDLDPNRVLDILLESFECRPSEQQFFIPVIQAFTSDSDRLCHMLGFKFHFYQQTQDSETPVSLYKVAALLLHHELITLNQLYPHLAPTDSDIFDKHKHDILDARQYARKLTVLVLSDKPEEKDKEDKESKSDQNENNQKLGLCEELLRIGSWVQAQQILDRLPRYFATGHQPVASALCALISATIQPIYIKYNGLPESVCVAQQKKPQAALLHPAVSTFQQLQAVVFPMVGYLGAHLSCDAILMVKMVRLGRAFMQQNLTQTNLPADLDAVFRGFLTILDEAVLPSMSLLNSNCCISEEIWALLKMFKYQLRYRLYGQWKNDAYSMNPKLIRARADCIDKAKYIMKRLSKENVKQLGRHLGKLSHSNPGILFEYILSQIQKYDNFIGPVVDSLKYLTSLSYDVLAYGIIEALANPEKERLKHDDTNLSLWLQSLAMFSSAIFKKYQIELTGLLEYVLNQLKAGKSYDLLVLREVIQKMAGIEVSEEITDDQLEAMAGGDFLKQEGGYFSQVRNTRKSSSRLRDILLANNLAVPMCLLMAQQRDSIIFTNDAEDERHIKLIGKLYDQCQDTLFQFGSFLATQLSVEELSNRLPKVEELVIKYHLPVEAAFFLTRMFYSHSIQAKYDELIKPHKKDKATMTPSFKANKYIEATEFVMKPIAEQICPLHVERIWKDMCPQFFLTFWSLNIYDLWVPVAAYEKQTTALKAQLTALEDNKDLNQSKKRKEKERCNSLIEKLKDEEKKQTDHVKNVMKRLEAEKESWILNKTNKNCIITDLLQVCVFPRCCFTAMDAVYCAKFIHKLHELKTPNFSSLICYDRIFSDYTCAVASLTENEAHRYGRFLCEALNVIMRWHSDRSIYEKECSCIGFMTVYRAGSQKVGAKADQLDYENYRHVCQKWQYRLAKASIGCLESGIYVQIRNALIVLLKILPHFPRVVNFGKALERRIDRLCQEEKEKRPDIFALAMGYAGQLKNKKKNWITEDEFHHRDVQKAQAQAAKQSSNGLSSSQTNDKGEEEGEVSSTTPDTTNNVKRQEVDGKIEEKKKKIERTDSPVAKSKNTDSPKVSSKEKKDERSKEPRAEKLRLKEPKDKGKDAKEGKISKDGEKKGKEKATDDKKEKSKSKDKHKGEKDKQKREEKQKMKEERKEKNKDGDRASSVASSSSHGSHGPEWPSPKPDERDSKRRRVDGVSCAKESDRKEKMLKSPTYNDKSRERDRERDGEKKLDRKRVVDHSEEREETKRHKTEDGKASKLNGDSDGHTSRIKDRHHHEHHSHSSKSHSKEREIIVTETTSKKSKDGSEKVKKKDKLKSKDR